MRKPARSGRPRFNRPASTRACTAPCWRCWTANCRPRATCRARASALRNHLPRHVLSSAPRRAHGRRCGPAGPRPIRNPAHVDLSNGTLVHYREGLQLYAGRQRERAAICRDEAGWCDLDGASLPPDALIYLIGLATEITTHGRYLATWHRVVCDGPPGMHTPRLSIVSFCNAGIDDVLPGGADLRASGIVYPPIERALLPVIGNVAYLESARGAQMYEVQ
ncbi:2OG-Fe(II) oxygenase family protein [Ralstonia solanacearum]|uniref:2OG-Fe(II) oxygenase family protein n=1 Tax=Ralstonia solanacearum TaxID=305 RepID=UPI001FF063C4|nr:2OG-Fe(II) oxygenase family protein [Ralstonia solanacearum]